MTPRTLGLVLALGCAPGHSPSPTPQDSTAPAPQAAEQTDECTREAEVTVHVENRGSMDVEITFGPYHPGRFALGLSSTTYRVPRAYLREPIWLQARGGLDTGGPAQVRTEYVRCNDATLIIGVRPANSFFYGDLMPSASRQQHAPAGTAAARHGTTAIRDAPAWAADAVWYQIFVERFRNGDPSNDPIAHDIEGVTNEPVPDGWRPTPWSQDWYRQEPWAKATGKDFYGTVNFRRYGGDLQGVLDRLDYLQDLGVTALYLNPVNDAPSLHKYDARNYRHIDRNFGPHPRGDEVRMDAETPWDPATWGWTAADSLFLVLVNEVHRRGMRIIMDYSWNHTGITFWAWRDVLKRQQASRFADWYEIERFDDPATKDTNEFAYRGWAGVPWLPEWKKVGRPAGETKGAIEGNLVPGVKDLIFSVTRRWLDPNGDGDPSDGVDGFRLDVAEMVPLGFWRDYRKFVRGINPDAYLVGEIWWEQWPDKMYDPAPWLQGDVFDAVMNYRWYMPTRSFFAGAPPGMTASWYAAYLDSLDVGIDSLRLRAMMNLTASHDSPRFGTSIYNPGRYKYHANPREDPDYKVDKPDEHTRTIQQMILVQQFTYVGAPHIWNGDEVGMWGADDPDERKPVVWGDLTYDDEVTHPFGKARPRDHVAPDTALFRVYHDLIALRKQHLRLFVDGTLTWLVTDDARGLLAYERVLGDQRAIVAFNVSDEAHEVTINAQGTYNVAFPSSDTSVTANGTLRAELPARAARVWIRE